MEVPGLQPGASQAHRPRSYRSLAGQALTTGRHPQAEARDSTFARAVFYGQNGQIPCTGKEEK